MIPKTLICLLFMSTAQAATFYVDGDLGSDCTSGNYSIAARACSGSDGNAYTDIRSAIHSVGAPLADGDTVNIRAGTYSEQAVDVRNCTGGAGTTIQAYNGESVIWQQVSWGAVNILQIQSKCDQVTIKGIEFIGVRPTSPNEGGASDDFWGNAIRVSGNGATRLIIVENCIFHDLAHTGIKAEGMRFEVRYSYFYNIGGYTTLSGGGDVSFRDFHDHALYLGKFSPQGSETIIEYNRFGKNIGGAGAHLYTQAGRHIVRYNVFEGTPRGTGGFWGVLLSCLRCQVYGNSFYSLRHGVMIFRSQGSNSIIKNNVFYGTRQCDIAVDTAGGISYPANNTVANNYLGSNHNPTCAAAQGNQTANGGDDYTTYDDSPNVVDATNPFIASSPSTWFDFRLAPTSTAIKAGATLAEDVTESLSASFDDALDPNGLNVPPTTPELSDQDDGANWDMGAFVQSDVTIAKDGTDPSDATIGSGGATGLDQSARTQVQIRSQE